MSTFEVKNENQLEEIALELLTRFKNNRVFIFSGELGSGKTTFIKYLCKALHVEGEVTSPTFALVNEYETRRDRVCPVSTAANTIYHFDFYRIKNETEVYDIGYEEYFYSGAYCFIEWPEKISGLIPKDAVKVMIEVKEENVRIITMNYEL